MQRITRNPPSDSFSTKIDSYRAQVDIAFYEELCQRRESPFFTPFADAFKGGKRLRPILLLLAYDSVRTRDDDPLPAAVAVELAHMESLIHDDVIDGDSKRRDVRSFHVRYGQERALLSADFILSMILSLATRYTDPRIMSTLATATAQMCDGELLERLVDETDEAVHPEVYQRIVLKKTASLFEAAATMGALIGGATAANRDALAAYARALGIAFQIHDDIVDSEQGQTIMLNLKGSQRSQNEYLFEMANQYISEAIDSLRSLKSSEAKQNLIQLAECVDARAIHQI